MRRNAANEAKGLSEEQDLAKAPRKGKARPEVATEEAAAAAAAAEAREPPEEVPDEEEEEEAAAEAEGDGEEDDEVEHERWRSEAYDAHFGVDWDAAGLSARQAALHEHRWELPGLGVGRALSSRAEAPSAPAGLDACLRACGVLPALREAWRRAHGTAPLSEAQRSLLCCLCSYRDVLHTDAAYDAHPPLLRVLSLHTMQHITVTQRLLMKNLKKNLQARDQGFTRPKVLVLLPLRAHALSFVREVLALLGDEVQVDHKSRFVAEFDDEEPLPEGKPDDYKALFGGNNDDCFRLGVRFQRKSAKLFAPFYRSELIIASPLGLRLGIGEEGDKERDADWLSSLEMVVAPYADVFTMQNWSHVRGLFEQLNALPTQQHDTDFSRVRSWYLDGSARQLRQSILLGAHPSAELSSLLRSCANTAGSVRLGRASYAGTLAASPPGLRQLFVRFDALDPTAAADARLAAFEQHVLPSIVRSLSAGPDGQTLLFVPSYFDFVRVKALLEREDLPFTALSEYSTPKEAQRARTNLQQRKLPLMLYTERAHFFRRHRLRGACNLCVYAPPSNAHFYVELAQMLEAGGGGTTVVLYCRLDLMPLQRLVGSERAARMLKDEKASCLFC